MKLMEVDNRSSVLKDLREASFDVGSNERRVIELIEVAGADGADTKEAFIIGYLVSYLKLGTLNDHNIAKAKQLLLKRNAYSKSASASARRTPDEEKAYSACRQAWKRYRNKIGIPRVDNRGGRRPPEFSATITQIDECNAEFALFRNSISDHFDDLPVGIKRQIRKLSKDLKEIGVKDQPHS